MKNESEVQLMPFHTIVIGSGFCGLAAAHELAKRGHRVTVLEQEEDIGGLAGSFPVNGVRLEKFYHHWFTSDHHITELVEELGVADQIVLNATRTGLYYANRFFKLSSPLDVLRFKPLAPLDRVRLGLLALRARGVKDWKRLEHLSAAQWLRQMGGPRVYEVVWEPLLRGKFGEYAEDISAVWFWNKLKLRGGSRSKDGAEQLAYYRGGFAALADALAAKIRSLGGSIRTNTRVDGLAVTASGATGVVSRGETLYADAIVATPALPIVADLLEPHLPPSYIAGLRRIRYLANVCLVLELDRSLSATYWLNVNDPTFPFVGLVEHTNFEPPTTYGGAHIVYLSKYLPESDPLFRMSTAEALDFSLPYLQKMFPAFERPWIRAANLWRARYSQPIVERHYSRLIPHSVTPLRGLYLASMAQVYPEDRGTNYAIREGKRVAGLICEHWPQYTLGEATAGREAPVMRTPSAASTE
jgi:protoporphyrinogen oxidase